MAKLSKRVKAFKERIEEGKAYPLEEAVTILSELSKVKFKESLDISINLGVDPRKSDQVVRGATVLPNGTGKDVRVAVFTQGEKADEAKLPVQTSLVWMIWQTPSKVGTSTLT